MINVYELFEKPMITILANMEIEGIKIDNKFLKILSSNFEKKILKFKKKFLKYQKKNLILHRQNNLVKFCIMSLKLLI